MERRQKLTVRELIILASMLFGMFFGAGNLIFPVYMGQLAGQNVWQASAGFIVTGVGLPLLGVAALGLSRSNSLMELSGKVGRRYGIFFTCALTLTIGPFFAVPRCATVSFEVGVAPLMGENLPGAALAVFSLVFFGAVLWFSLRPSGILTWIGKIINPVFLLFLGMLVAAALISPLGSAAEIRPEGVYAETPFLSGCLEGYNTMDALAALLFGVVVVDVIRGLGVQDESAIAMNTVKAGIFSCALMALIYAAATLVGAQSRGEFPLFANGGTALAALSHHYFGRAGGIILAVIVTMACLKTSIGLVTSCSETFRAMFPKGPSYNFWAVGFSAAAFLIANTGLNTILSYSAPVLMFLYPLAITLILLTLAGRFYENDRAVYAAVTVCTLPAAVLDFLRFLPGELKAAVGIEPLLSAAEKYVPFLDMGFAWVCPAVLGLVIGLAIHFYKKSRRKADLAE